MVHGNMGNTTKAGSASGFWLQSVILGSLFLAVFWEAAQRSYMIATHDPEWFHILLVPFVSAYLVYQRRAAWQAEAARPCGWGLAWLVISMLGYLLAIFPVRNAMLMGYAAVSALAGLVWFMTGTRVTRHLLPALAFMVFAVKVSDRVWDAVSWKLQMLAARGAAFLLFMTGADVDLKGATLTVWDGVRVVAALNVEEACSGLRLLMGLLAVGTALVFLSNRRPLVRGLQWLLIVPVALVLNMVRIVISGWLVRVAPDLIRGDAHGLVAFIMVIAAVGLLVLAGRGLEVVLPARGRAAPTGSTEAS